MSILERQGKLAISIHYLNRSSEHSPYRDSSASIFQYSRRARLKSWRNNLRDTILACRAPPRQTGRYNINES